MMLKVIKANVVYNSTGFTVDSTAPLGPTGIRNGRCVSQRNIILMHLITRIRWNLLNRWPNRNVSAAQSLSHQLECKLC